MRITLGRKYRDKRTGFEGVAIAVTKWIDYPDQVKLENSSDDRVAEYTCVASGVEPIVAPKRKAKRKAVHRPVAAKKPKPPANRVYPV